MKSLSNVIFLTLLSLVLIYGRTYAITGECSNCHTMHNSQNGQQMADRADPYAYLLRASCVGCHIGPTGEKNDFGAPIVYHTTAPTGQGGGRTLAGGDFYIIVVSDYLGQVTESNETDNTFVDWFVWTPYALTGHASVLRQAPPALEQEPTLLAAASTIHKGRR